ncbi:Hypothetical predicted protein [Prunus dulcis]|uniref:Uncharacterized protein n=1 Tax=Prunus dulcis TaxID=3755 RepID=A0A5E4F4Z7_PRUDU|nr:Hypothetical predicted protein [Prunus dulcis]
MYCIEAATIRAIPTALSKGGPGPKNDFQRTNVARVVGGLHKLRLALRQNQPLL